MIEEDVDENWDPNNEQAFMIENTFDGREE